MINIKVLFDSETGYIYPVASIEADGHAGSGPYGHDLACAAVSAILVGGINALGANQNSYNIVVEEGHIEIKLKDHYFSNENANRILHVIITQLKTIAKSYPKLILIEENVKNKKGKNAL